MLLRYYEEQFTQAKTFNELNKLLTNYLAELNIRTFAFTYYFHHPSSENEPKYDYSTPNYLAWHQHYIQSGYEDIDMTLQAVNRSTLPVVWDVRQQLKSAKTQREKKLRLDSIAFGIEKGICIPIHGADNDFAVLLLVQMKAENGLENWLDLKYELFAAAYQYHFFLKKLLDHELPLKKANLTIREMQCLILTAKQYSAKEIAVELKITERTVNFHVQKLNKKLGVKYKHEALLKAIKQGLINI